MTNEQLNEIMGMVAAHQKLSKLDQIAWRKTLGPIEYGPAMAALIDAVSRHLRVLPAHVVPEQLQVAAGKFEHAEVGWALVREGLRACTNEAAAFRRLVAETWDPERPETKAVTEMGRDLLPASGQTLEQCRWSFMRAYNRHAGISEVGAEPKPMALDDGRDDVAELVAETQSRRALESGTSILPTIGRTV